MPPTTAPADAPLTQPLDLGLLAKIKTLHNYANAQRGFVTESWATRAFKRTYDMAYAMCSDGVDTTMGFTISYRPSQDDHIHASLDRGYGSNRFHRDLPLSGALAAAFLADLEDLAMEQALEDQRADEEAQLRMRARQRLDLILRHGTR